MITVRPGSERGHFDHGWLDTYHTFSFASYHDPRHMGFRSLRVINEDRVQPAEGFGTHAHRDMEILTWVLEGALEHKDSMGNGSVIRPGDIQRMSPGTGVTHSEFNPSRKELVHLLQIWLLPSQRGLTPSYEEKRFEPESRRGVLRLIAARDGRDGAVDIHQDADLWTALLEPTEAVRHPLAAGRHAWLHVARGKVTANGTKLEAGDGAALSSEPSDEGKATDRAEVLLFDLSKSAKRNVMSRCERGLGPRHPTEGGRFGRGAQAPSESLTPERPQSRRILHDLGEQRREEGSAGQHADLAPERRPQLGR